MGSYHRYILLAEVLAVLLAAASVVVDWSVAVVWSVVGTALS